MGLALKNLLFPSEDGEDETTEALPTPMLQPAPFCQNGCGRVAAESGRYWGASLPRNSSGDIYYAQTGD